MGVNSCWVNPVEIHNTNINTNFIPNPVQSQPSQHNVPARHVGMPPITPVCKKDCFQIKDVKKLFSNKRCSIVQARIEVTT